MIVVLFICIRFGMGIMEIDLREILRIFMKISCILDKSN